MVDFKKHGSLWWQDSGTTPAADGTPLAYAYGGPEGARTLVCCNGAGVSTFFWDKLGEYFVPDQQVVVWDYRGHGASGNPHRPASITMTSMAEDLARVMDATKTEKAVLLGHSMGAQVIFEFYRLFPDRVLGLVPTLGSFGRPADTFIDPRVGQLLFRGAYRVGTDIPELLSLFFRLTLKRTVTWHFVRRTGLVHSDLCHREDLEPYLDHLARLDQRLFFETVRAGQDHDAGPMLGDIQCPTLVVAGERDLFTPRHLSLEMAARIPHAELLEIPRGSHAALIEQPELINLRIEKFLRTSVSRFEAKESAVSYLTPASGVSSRGGVNH